MRHSERFAMAMTNVSREQIFLFYAGGECARALRQLNEVDRLLSVRGADGIHQTREWKSVFDAIRLALHFSANVSKVFWPQKKAEGRGEKLRRLTGLPDQHVLSDRRLRNHIEHFDERLDIWTATSPRPYLTEEMIFYSDMVGRVNEHAVRDAVAILYDEKSGTIHLFGEAFSLPDLRLSLEDVQRHISHGLGNFYPQS
jgi:hypothetical protein